MLFNFLTIFPELVSQSLQYGVIGQAIKCGHIKANVIQLREFASDKHRSVDDKPFGGSDGMVMKPEVLGNSLGAFQNTKLLFPSPQGQLFTQAKAKDLSYCSEITFLCGRYAGVDERVLVKYGIQEVSVGDYVVSGGEMPALIIMDAVARHVPGVLGNKVSVLSDSFATGILEAPAFTRPQVWGELKVPDVIVSGDHARIHEFNQWMALLTTLRKRPELLNQLDPQSELGKKWHQKAKLKQFYSRLTPEDKKSCAVTDMENLLNGI